MGHISPHMIYGRYREIVRGGSGATLEFPPVRAGEYRAEEQDLKPIDRKSLFHIGISRMKASGWRLIKTDLYEGA
jgi:hypothetical protein